MKSDHRHELKTNELADWLAHFPDWLEQNRTNLLATAGIIVLVIAVYVWRNHSRDVASVRVPARLTNLISRVPEQINNAMNAAMQGTDQSFGLMPVAQDLKEFADDVSNDNMAALALIKRGEALRAELHLRLEDVKQDELTKQIALAQASYQEALNRKPSNKALAAAAQFGLGLCEEELGNFDKAAEIYRAVVQQAEYVGSVARAAAEYRLKVMDDFKTRIAFKPAPPKPQAAVPTLQIPGSGASAPTVTQVPNEPVIGPMAPPVEAGKAPATDSATPAAPAGTTPVPAPVPTPVEANKPAGG